MLDSAPMKTDFTSFQALGLFTFPTSWRSTSSGTTSNGTAGWRRAAVCLLLGISLILAGCGDSQQTEEVKKQEVEALLLEYLPELGRAYAEGDPGILEGMAVPKEMSKIEVRIRELVAQGRVFEPTFKTLVVEDISTWNYSNAFVTTFEVWDLKSYSLGDRVLMSESLDQGNRVKYQLKRRDDTWVVLYRELDQTYDQE